MNVNYGETKVELGNVTIDLSNESSCTLHKITDIISMILRQKYKEDHIYNKIQKLVRKYGDHSHPWDHSFCSYYEEFHIDRIYIRFSYNNESKKISSISFYVHLIDMHLSDSYLLHKSYNVTVDEFEKLLVYINKNYKKLIETISDFKSDLAKLTPEKDFENRSYPDYINDAYKYTLQREQDEN